MMIRRILLASAGALALAGTALAADLRPPPPPPLPPPPVFSWSGLYIGGQVGYDWGNDNSNLNAFVATTPTTLLGSTSSTNLTGAIGGAHLGYNWQFNQFVLGVESDVDSTNLNGHEVNGLGILPGGVVIPLALTDKVRSTIEGSFRGRVGWAWNNWLFYGTGGIAFSDFTSNYQFASILTDDRTSTRVGWTAGGGIEWAFTNNWIFGVEYRSSDFGHFTDNDLFSLGATTAGLVGTPLIAANESHHLTENRVQARASYKFDLFNPAPVVAKY
jgi:outer membrane immunogenic protein